MGDSSALLDGIAVFVKVVDSSSFTEAAQQLGHSASFVSKEVSRLEARLGVRLMNRTTRSISLTDAGRAYYERCQQLVIDAEDAERAMGQLQESPRGLLKISAPVTFGLTHLGEALPLFLKKYPDIDLEVDYNERVVDLVSEGFDVVVRIGHLKDSNLIARKFMQSKGAIVASPDYLKRRGTPSSPDDLRGHECISFSLSNAPKQWGFEDRNGDSLSININTRVICNSAELEISMAIAGIGITRVPLLSCEQALKEGKLLKVLEDYEKPDFSIYAVYPHRQYLSAKVQVFVEFLCQHFAS